MSGKRARRERREAAAPPPIQRKGERRRASTRVLVIAAIVGLALAAAAVGGALAFGGKSHSSKATTPTVGSATAATALPFAADAAREFAGIPQHGLSLGSPKAPVTLVEYIDLQCPFCREFEATVMPTIVRRYVRTGKVRIEARPIAIIGPDSLPARNAAIAAAVQNRAFPFMQVVYFNQGTENTGWLNKDFVTKAAASVPGLVVKPVVDGMTSSTAAAQGRQFDGEANAAKIPGTPAIFVGRRGGRPHLVPSNQALSAIAAALSRQ